MKIIQNIPGICKAIASLPPLNGIKRDIDRYKASGELEKEHQAILRATQTWGAHLVKSFHVTLNVEGEENIPKADEGPVVYVCNHQSFADIPIMCDVLTNLPFSFVARDSLSSMPLYGNWMERIHSVMMDRDDPRASLRAISNGIEELGTGFSLLIFPEGTRSQGKDMADFKKGALKLATKPGVPIVPISLHGSYRILEEKGYLCTGKTVDVIVHPRVETAGLSRKEEKEVDNQVYETVLNGWKTLKTRQEERGIK